MLAPVAIKLSAAFRTPRLSFFVLSARSLSAQTVGFGAKPGTFVESFGCKETYAIHRQKINDTLLAAPYRQSCPDGLNEIQARESRSRSGGDGSHYRTGPKARQGNFRQQFEHFYSQS